MVQGAEVSWSRLVAVSTARLPHTAGPNVGVETRLSAAPTLERTPLDTFHPLFGSRHLARLEGAMSETGSPQVGLPVRASDGALAPLQAIRLPARSVVQPSSLSPLSVAS